MGVSWHRICLLDQRYDCTLHGISFLWFAFVGVRGEHPAGHGEAVDSLLSAHDGFGLEFLPVWAAWIGELAMHHAGLEHDSAEPYDEFGNVVDRVPAQDAAGFQRRESDLEGSRIWCSINRYISSHHDSQTPCTRRCSNAARPGVAGRLAARQRVCVPLRNVLPPTLLAANSLAMRNLMCVTPSACRIAPAPFCPSRLKCGERTYLNGELFMGLFVDGERPGETICRQVSLRLPSTNWPPVRTRRIH